MTQTQSKKPGSAMLLLGVLGVAVILMVLGSGLGLFAVWRNHVFLGTGGPMLTRFGPLLGLAGFGMIIQFLLAIWVGFDANKRGMNGLLWGLLVLFTFIVGLLVYLIVCQSPWGRNGNGANVAAAVPAAASKTCGKCGKQVEESFRICPYCGDSLVAVCPGCSRPTTQGWKVCPYCSADLEA